MSWLLGVSRDRTTRNRRRHSRASVETRASRPRIGSLIPLRSALLSFCICPSVFVSLDQRGTAAFLPSKTCLRGGHGDARLDVPSKVGQHHLQRGEAGDDVELVGVAHVADPDDLALELVLPADGRDPEPVGEAVADVCRPSGPAGTRNAVKPSAGRALKSSRPSAWMPAWHASLMRPVPLPDVLDPLVLDPPQEARSARISVCAGVYGVSNSFIFLRAALRLK